MSERLTEQELESVLAICASAGLVGLAPAVGRLMVGEIRRLRAIILRCSHEHCHSFDCDDEVAAILAEQSPSQLKRLRAQGADDPERRR